MRILIDLTSLADNFSGIERYAASISYNMIIQTNDEYILIFKKSVHSMFVGLKENKRIIFVTISECNKLLFNQVKLPYVISRYKADWYLFMAFPVPILLFRKNMVSTIHDICCWDCPWTMNGISKWYFRISHRVAISKCKKIITISKFSKRRIEDKLKYSSEKIWLIYCGIEKNFLNYTDSYEMSEKVKNKYNLPEQYILSLSTLEPRKNLNLLVEAYAQLVKEKMVDIPLVLAGRKGWKIDELFSEIDSTVVNKILFTGFIDEEDLPVVYGNAKLFVFPSMYEGFGIPPLEALACNTLVLSSNATSLPEVLGDAAKYFNYNSVEECALNILFMLQISDKDMKDLYLKGKNQIDKFHWEKEAAKLYTLISKN